MSEPARTTITLPDGEMNLYVLTESQYESLRYWADWYNALRDAGVDNWSGYDYAAEIMYGSTDDE